MEETRWLRRNTGVHYEHFLSSASSQVSKTFINDPMRSLAILEIPERPQATFHVLEFVEQRRYRVGQWETSTFREIKKENSSVPTHVFSPPLPPRYTKQPSKNTIIQPLPSQKHRKQSRLPLGNDLKRRLSYQRHWKRTSRFIHRRHQLAEQRKENPFLIEHMSSLLRPLPDI